MSFGANKSSGSSKSKVSVWKPQAGYLKDIYSQGQEFFNQGSPLNDQSIALGQTGLDQIGGLYGQASQYFDPLLAGGQAGQVDATDATQQYLNQTLAGQGQGMETLGNLQQGGLNPYLESTVNAATNDIMRNYNQQIMPSITNEAAATGGLGGSRQGVAQGIAAQNVTNQIADTTGEMYGQAYDADQRRRLAASQAMLAQQGQAGQISSGLMGQASNVGLGAMGQAGQLSQLGMAPSEAANQLYGRTWNPLQYYQSIIGGPVSGAKSRAQNEAMGIKAGAT